METKLSKLILSLFVISAITLASCDNSFEQYSSNNGDSDINISSDSNFSSYIPPTSIELNDDTLTKEIAYVYSSIAIDLLSYGYEVFNAKIINTNETNYGIGYCDLSNGYQKEGEDKVYLSSGFLSFDSGGYVKQDKNTMFLAPIDEQGEEIVDANYGYVIDYIEDGIPDGHFIVDSHYVKYHVEDGKVNTYLFDNDSANYDLSLGAIYDYDNNEFEYIPYDEISSEPISYVPLVEKIDYDALKNNLHRLIDEQNDNGYTFENMTIAYISVDTLNALNGFFSQEDLLNGYSYDYLSSLEYDSNSQYIYFNDDGTITIKDLPPLPSGEVKQLLDWVVDGLAIAGIGGLAILSMTFLGPVGPVVTAGLIGGGIEYFTQTVIQGKKYSDVKWEKVGIMTVSGAISAVIPCSGVLGYVGAGLVGGLTSGAMAAVDGAPMEEILLESAKGAVTSLLLHGLFSSCFPKGTPILTKDGLLPIETIKAGTLVASYNFDKNEIEYKPVLEVFSHRFSELIDIGLDNGNHIISTNSHPYYDVNSGSFISANELNSSSRLINKAGKQFEVISSSNINEEQEVYNFNVLDNHNYYVGEDSILVHNSCKHGTNEWKKTRSDYWKSAADNGDSSPFYRLTDDNLSLMKRGKAPVGIDGYKAELHHTEGIAKNMKDVVPLSKTAHTAFHKQYGYVGFTANNLTDFLKNFLVG